MPPPRVTLTPDASGSGGNTAPDPGTTPDPGESPAPDRGTTPDPGERSTPDPETPPDPGERSTPDPETSASPEPRAPETSASPPPGNEEAPTEPGDSVNGDSSLPIFRDPELLRRAQEALGLDRDMRYTDADGVWDLTIAPPGTPPCRDYTAEEIRALNSPGSGTPAPSGEQVIPRDSCQWPAFIRWLLADPAPGEVSNWTKFTGLPERNLELVVIDPPAAPSGAAPPEQPDPAQSGPGENGQSGSSENGQSGSGENGQDSDGGPAQDSGGEPAQGSGEYTGP
ncbi:hypothetical protein [Planobispora longispora]|uniref:hypothetical protein n=1 Tax=Planobispora longispora TaxID=28887 RepID=UPI001941DB0F|nr:hypothetical protein [Planobispora longispora]